MQALVTGASGFIGSQLVNQLASKGFQVRVLLRQASSQRNLQGVPYEVYYGDLRDYSSLKEAVRNVDYVFHLAGTVTATRRNDFFQANAQGTENLAQACAETTPNQIKRFVYVSSLAASGPASALKERQEEDQEAPVSAYGESKLAGELALRQVALNRFPVTILRPPVVYGPRDKGVFEFVKLINSGIAPFFPSTDPRGEKFYSVIHVSDLVDCIERAGFCSTQEFHETFFVCDDGVYSWSEILESIAKHLGKKPIRLRMPKILWKGLAASFSAAGFILKKSFPLSLDKLNELRPDYWICSNERAKRVLGFQPQVHFSVGMAETIRWYRENHWV